jgi:LacI family transcriptional regulator
MSYRHSLPSHPHIGVLVNTDSSYGRSILQGVARYANLQRNWIIFKDLSKTLKSRGPWPQFDGLIFAGVSVDLFNYGVKRCKNVVRCSGSGDPAISCVVALDDEAAGAQAAEHLINCRFENFAYYGILPEFLTTMKRLNGFRQAVEQKGFTCIECPVPHPTERQIISHSHHPRLIKWLREIPRPIGIMTFDDGDANDLAGTCLEAGIAVPEQVAIVGTNNDELLCETAWPPLSSVVADFTRVGYAAAQLLDRMICGETLSEQDRFLLLPPLGVMQRQSTDVLAVKDPNVAEAVRFIRDHACDPCSVGDVLQHVPVGRRWLERQFVQNLGRTPLEEITRVRIETAQRLLLHTDQRLPEIAERCGFGAVQTLGRVFHQTTKLTPAAWRRAHRGVQSADGSPI